MITEQEFKTMQTSTRCLIETVFNYEEEFKAEFITPQCTYSPTDYELDRVHVSGSILRVTVRFEDCSNADMYFDLTKVIEWYYDIAEKVTGNKEKNNV